MRNISRIDSRSTHAWFFRRQIRGVLHTASFSDRVWGGKGRALEAAIAHRAELEQEHPPALTPPGRLPQRRRAAGPGRRSKLSGVWFGSRVSRKRGRVYVYQVWMAFMAAADGRRRVRCWSVGAWGYDGAKRCAEQWRREQLAAYERATGIRV